MPAAVAALADGEPCRAVWRNELGGITFKIGAHRYMKWNPAGTTLDLTSEVIRLRWANGRASVPTLLDHGNDDEGTWLVTAALRGESAVSARWKADPATAVRVLGQGLRRLHDALPISECPFTWAAQDRLRIAHSRAAAGLTHPQKWRQQHQHLTVADALTILDDLPVMDHMVVCHGDSCAPNTLIDHDGEFAGHVDLGALGVADRWADLAIATWSTTWNYGPGWEQRLLDAYGIDPDEEKIAYYRLLWDLT